MVADRGKKPKLKDATAAAADDSDHLDSDLVLAIEKLQEFQDQLDKVGLEGTTEEDIELLKVLINEEASEEVLAVEQKYNGKRRPIYTKRDEVIKSIPDFWLTAFQSHPALGDLLSDEDAKIFRYLDSLDVEDFKDLKFGYSITFNFKPNPYFEDTKLTKSFTFFDEGTTKITGTNINWKSTANGVVHEKKGNKRPASEDSFFSWFSETQQKDIIEGLNDEVAEIIKEDLWPNPLKYFNNEADEEDSDGDEDDDEEKGDFDEQDDDGEEDGEDGDEEE